VPILVAMGTLIRFTAIVACTFVALGFIAFANDELGRGSQTQQDALSEQLDNSPGTVPRAALAVDGEDLREQQHGTPREAIDDVDDVLLAPFQDIISSRDAWVDHGVPSLLALLLYGVGLGTLANFLPKQRRLDGDWRTAT
jgi:hypothetical protein